MRTLLPLLVVVSLCGCWEQFEKQVQKDPNSIIGKTTQDISEFKPDAGLPVSDSKVQITNPITGPLEAYGPMMEQLHKSYVKQALDLYRAEHDRYPANFEEFMRDIIQANNIRLPVLPGNARYQYDVANHRLEVVVVPEKPAEGAAEPPANKP